MRGEDVNPNAGGGQPLAGLSKAQASRTQQSSPAEELEQGPRDFVSVCQCDVVRPALDGDELSMGDERLYARGVAVWHDLVVRSLRTRSSISTATSDGLRQRQY